MTLFTKNISYPTPEEIPIFCHYSARSGVAGLSEFALKMGYIKDGCQIHVDKELSDELSLSDTDNAITFADVPWPSSNIEFFFEDPNIPTLLAANVTVDEINRLTKKYDDDFPSLEYSSATVPMFQAGIQETAIPRAFCSLCITPKDWGNLMSKSELPTSADSIPLEEHEAHALADVITIAMKVLMYASIPHYRPKTISRKQMTKGGKAGVHNRPNRPAIRVIHLPAVVHDNVKHHGQGAKNKLKSHTRRGHFRFFRNPCFTKMKGQFIYVPPVKIGDQGEVQNSKTKYKVHKR